MNILFANTQEYNPQIGGVERVSSVLAQNFVEMGHNVYFLACLRSPYSKSYKPVVEQIILPDAHSYNSDNNIEKFIEYVKEKEIDVIVNQAGNIMEFTELCSSVTHNVGLPLISAVHTNPDNTYKNLRDFSRTNIFIRSRLKLIRRMLLFPYRCLKAYRAARLLYTRLCDVSDRVVLLSERYIPEFNKLTGTRISNNVTAIANPNSLSSTYDVGIKKPTIAFVGRLDDGKRPDRMVQIWSNLCREFPSWTLKIAGDGPCKQQLIDYAKAKCIRNLQFLGFCDPSQLYEEAEVICMTSSFEGFPMVLVEGMNYGCIPMGFGSFEAIYDIIDSGYNGWVVKPFDLRDYEKKLRMLMVDASLRDRMRVACETTRGKFEIGSIASKWMKLFSEVSQ